MQSCGYLFKHLFIVFANSRFEDQVLNLPLAGIETSIFTAIKFAYEIQWCYSGKIGRCCIKSWGPIFRNRASEPTAPTCFRQTCSKGTRVNTYYCFFGVGIKYWPVRAVKLERPCHHTVTCPDLKRRSLCILFTGENLLASFHLGEHGSFL